MRYSKQREQILMALKRSCDHPTADMLYARLRGENPNISLATVYRNLNMMADAGEIRRILFDDAKARYDANPAPHEHMQCLHCRKVFDCSPEFYHIMQQQIFEQTGFLVTQASTLFEWNLSVLRCKIKRMKPFKRVQNKKKEKEKIR